jgi:hypothetical protein
MGIDGRIYPVGVAPEAGGKKGQPELGFTDVWYPVRVKQQDKAGRPDIDAFETAMNREGRVKGVFVSFGYTADAIREIHAFRRREGKLIVPLTVREILDEEAAQKLA